MAILACEFNVRAYGLRSPALCKVHYDRAVMLCGERAVKEHMTSTDSDASYWSGRFEDRKVR